MLAIVPPNSLNWLNCSLALSYRFLKNLLQSITPSLSLEVSNAFVIDYRRNPAIPPNTPAATSPVIATDASPETRPVIMSLPTLPIFLLFLKDSVHACYCPVTSRKMASAMSPMIGEARSSTAAKASTIPSSIADAASPKLCVSYSEE